MKQYPSILQLDQSGLPHRWIGYERCAFYIAKNLVAWSMFDDGFTIYGGVNRVGDQSSMDIPTIVAVRGESSHRTLNRTPLLSNRVLFRRDHMQCAYCGNFFRSEDLTRDHILASAKGGEDSWNNVVTCCIRCNHFKGDRSLDDIGYKLLYQPYTPNRWEYLLLTNTKALRNQKEFLRAGIPQHSRALYD